MSKTRVWAATGVGTLLAVLAFAGGYRIASGDIRQAAAAPSDVVGTPAGVQVASIGDPAAEPIDSLRLFNSVLYYLKSQYVDKLGKDDDRKLAYGTIRGLIAHLEDPSTRFLEPDEVRGYRDANNGKFAGLGAVLTTDSRVENGIKQYVLEIVSALPGSATEKAGLRAGDVIDAINGRWVLSHNLNDDLEPLRKAVRNKKATQADLIRAAREAASKQENAILISDAVKMLTQPSDSPVKLTIKRAGAPRPFEVTATLGTVEIPPADYRLLNERWGYIHLALLNAKAAEELGGAVKTLKPRMRGLVLDLRDNAGGDEGSAMNVLGKLLPQNTLVGYREQHKGDKTKRALKLATGTRFTMPITILTNGGTNNLSELVVAALKDNAGARVIGTTTHGDGMVHTPIPFQDGSLLILTTGKYYTSKGVSFQARGLVPDVKAESSGNYGEPLKDLPLQKAIELLAKGGA